MAQNQLELLPRAYGTGNSLFRPDVKVSDHALKVTIGGADTAVTGDFNLRSDLIANSLSTRKLLDSLGINKELQKAAQYALVLNGKDDINALAPADVTTGLRKLVTNNAPVGIKKYAVERYIELYNAVVDLVTDYTTTYKDSAASGTSLKEADAEARQVASAKWKIAMRKIKDKYSDVLEEKTQNMAKLKTQLDFKKATSGFDI